MGEVDYSERLQIGFGGQHAARLQLNTQPQLNRSRLIYQLMHQTHRKPKSSSSTINFRKIRQLTPGNVLSLSIQSLRRVEQAFTEFVPCEEERTYAVQMLEKALFECCLVLRSQTGQTEFQLDWFPTVDYCGTPLTLLCKGSSVDKVVYMVDNVINQKIPGLAHYLPKVIVFDSPEVNKRGFISKTLEVEGPQQQSNLSQLKFKIQFLTNKLRSKLIAPSDAESGDEFRHIVKPQLSSFAESSKTTNEGQYGKLVKNALKYLFMTDGHYPSELNEYHAPIAATFCSMLRYLGIQNPIRITRHHRAAGSALCMRTSKKLAIANISTSRYKPGANPIFKQSIDLKSELQRHLYECCDQGLDARGWLCYCFRGQVFGYSKEFYMVEHRDNLYRELKVGEPVGEVYRAIDKYETPEELVQKFGQCQVWDQYNIQNTVSIEQFVRKLETHQQTFLRLYKFLDHKQSSYQQQFQCNGFSVWETKYNPNFEQMIVIEKILLLVLQKQNSRLMGN